MIYRGSLQIDWNDLDAVKSVARPLKAFIVKYPDRQNYNIPADVERAVLAGATVVWRPEETKCPMKG